MEQTVSLPPPHRTSVINGVRGRVVLCGPPNNAATKTDCEQFNYALTVVGHGQMGEDEERGFLAMLLLID